MDAKKARLLFPLTFLILGNWSTDQTTVDVSGLKKNRVNFYGVLHTRNGEIYNVENVSVGRLYKQIPVYEKPSTTTPKLDDDPKKGIISKLDLKEIQEIRVPHPSTMWHYQRTDGSRKTDYIAIEVKQNNQICSYLIDTHRKLMCDQIDPCGPTEKEVPFKSLDRIILSGYKQRDETKQDDKKSESKSKESVEEKKKRCGCNKKQNKMTQARPNAPHNPEYPDDKDCKPKENSQKIALDTDNASSKVVNDIGNKETIGKGIMS